MKIVTLGAGFVSEHLTYKIITERVLPDTKQIGAILDYHKPDVIINCIGKTGRPNIDWCETHKTETAIANTVIPLLLADECSKRSIHMIQIGSGCIFSGNSPKPNDVSWDENDPANPVSYYSNTKYSCDLLIGSMSNVTTLRIRMPISTKNNPRNLINKLKGYKQIIDIPNSVTFMDDLVRCVDWVIDEGHTGIFHVTNPEPLTAAQVMREYQKYKPDHTFEIITGEQLDQLTRAKRSNCILDSTKLYDTGFRMTNSQEALEECMKKYIMEL